MPIHPSIIDSRLPAPLPPQLNTPPLEWPGVLLAIPQATTLRCPSPLYDKVPIVCHAVTERRTPSGPSVLQCHGNWHLLPPHSWLRHTGAVQSSNYCYFRGDVDACLVQISECQCEPQDTRTSPRSDSRHTLARPCAASLLHSATSTDYTGRSALHLDAFVALLNLFPAASNLSRRLCWLTIIKLDNADSRSPTSWSSGPPSCR